MIIEMPNAMLKRDYGWWNGTMAIFFFGSPPFWAVRIDGRPIEPVRTVRFSFDFVRLWFDLKRDRPVFCSKHSNRLRSNILLLPVRVCPLLPVFLHSKPNFSTYFIVSNKFNLLFMGFTEFYRVLPSFTEFYRVLPSFTEFYRVVFTEFQ